MACHVEGCEHPADYMDESSCACHIDIQFFYTLDKDAQVEAIRRAALENDQFEVDAEGEIRVVEDGVDDGA